MSANCPHNATVVHSVTMVIDECKQCGGYLVWCENPRHADTRHWHYVDTESDARTLATGGGIPGKQGGIYGVKRPGQITRQEPGRSSLR